MTQRALIVIARQPASGQSKPWLSPPLDSGQAAALYTCFIRDTLENVRAARKLIDFQPIIAYLPEDAESYFRELAPDFELLLQQGADLSERLNNIMTHYLTSGYDQVMIMDSDSPTLPADTLRRAFALLDSNADVSLGPCDDGDYYLIGLKRPAPDLFLKVTMGTPNVVRDTLARARENGLSVARLPDGYGIDEVDDLYRLVAEFGKLPATVALNTRMFMMQHPDILSAGA
jgi:rSAM/selenodomain-associated transferase 1